MFIPVPVVGIIMDVQYTCLRSMLSKLVEKHELGKNDFLADAYVIRGGHLFFRGVLVVS